MFCSFLFIILYFIGGVYIDTRGDVWGRVWDYLFSIIYYSDTVVAREKSFVDWVSNIRCGIWDVWFQVSE